MNYIGRWTICNNQSIHRECIRCFVIYWRILSVDPYDPHQQFIARQSYRPYIYVATKPSVHMVCLVHLLPTWYIVWKCFLEHTNLSVIWTFFLWFNQVKWNCQYQRIDADSGNYRSVWCWKHDVTDKNNDVSFERHDIHDY